MIQHTEIQLGYFFVTSEEVGHRWREAVGGSPQQLLLPVQHPASSVLVVQTAKEEAIISHLKQHARVRLKTGSQASLVPSTVFTFHPSHLIMMPHLTK